MELKIYWTDFLKKELQNIFDYHKEKASLTVAKNLVIGIAKEVIKLQNQPNIGQIELSIENRTKEFRYIIFKHYKIIYWINLKNKSIEIFDVFDSRQSPIKIKRTK
ncbi:MAG: type II toxin-antitoxin system RelE/ParE family toxin [Bacteroidota bacterium]